MVWRLSNNDYLFFYPDSHPDRWREMYLGALFLKKSNKLVNHRYSINSEITSKRTAGVQKWWFSDHLHLSSDSASAIPSLSAKWLCSPRYHTVASISFTIYFSMSPDFVSYTYNENWIVSIGKDVTSIEYNYKYTAPLIIMVINNVCGLCFR